MPDEHFDWAVGCMNVSWTLRALPGIELRAEFLKPIDPYKPLDHSQSLATFWGPLSAMGALLCFALYSKANISTLQAQSIRSPYTLLSPAAVHEYNSLNSQDEEPTQLHALGYTTDTQAEYSR